jgi:peptide/nickel transport system substrate-binding protein
LGGRPYLDRYVYRNIPEHSTLLADLLNGAVDVYVSVVPHHAERIEEADHLDLRTFPHRGFFFVAWNSRRPQLTDVRVRKAMTLGLNRAQILEAVRPGAGVVANSSVPPTHWAFDPTFSDSLSFDPVAADSLLEEAGWLDEDGDGIRENDAGDPLSLALLTNPNQEREEVAEMIQAQLGELGIRIRLRLLDWPVLLP